MDPEVLYESIYPQFQIFRPLLKTLHTSGLDHFSDFREVVLVTMRAAHYMLLIASFVFFDKITAFDAQNIAIAIYKHVMSDGEEKIPPVNLSKNPDTHSQSFEAIRSPIRSWALAEEAVVQLETFIWRLKSFVRDGQFDSTGFSKLSGKMNDQLANIRLRIHLTAPSNQKYLNQVAYAAELLRHMETSYVLLQFYTLEGDRIGRVIHLLIHLNLELITMFDRYGVPDCRRKDYERLLTKLTERKTEYGQLFYSLNGRRLAGARVAFRSQMSLAENTLIVLKKAIGHIGC